MAKAAKEESSRYQHYSDTAMSYAYGVVAGDISACLFVKQACQRQIDDMARPESDDFPYHFDVEAAGLPCAFSEMLPHVKGRWARSRLNLTLSPWQIFWRIVVFGWINRSGFRRFRTAYIEVPRKNGKSVDGASTGLYMLVADLEFGAEIYAGATSEKQAFEVFRPAKLMAERTPEFLDHYDAKIYGKSIVVPTDGSRFEPLIGNPGDGAAPSLAVIDEFHEHLDPRQFDTMLTGMGSRDQPLMLVITTAGTDMGGPCYELRSRVVRTLSGVESDPSLFGMIYTIDVEDDWSVPDALVKANPNIDVSVSREFLEARQREAASTASRQNVFLTKHLNIWVGAKAAWMDMQRWAQAPQRLSMEALAGRECFVGVDLASHVDVAAVIWVFPPTDDAGDEVWHIHGRYYLPEEVVIEHHADTHGRYAAWSEMGLVRLTDGNVIDFDVIIDDILADRSSVNDVEIGYDPRQASHFATMLTAEGCTMVQVVQSTASFSQPMRVVEGLVSARRLAHGGCPVLTWMMSNVVARANAKDELFPRKEVPANKIDGVVAMLIAINRASAAREPPPKPSVYTTRGFRML